MDLRIAKSVRENEIEPYDHSVLILGMSCSGKSALVNTLVNCVLGTNIGNLKVAIKCEKYPEVASEFHDYCENSYGSTTRTQFFKINGPLTNNKTVLLVDTPSFDCFDQNEDNIKVAEIIKNIKLVKRFDAVFYTHRNSGSRLTPQIVYYLSRFREIIPRDLENSIIKINTFYIHNTSFNDEVFPFPIQENFKINNSLFMYSQEECKQSLKKNKKLTKILEKLNVKMRKIMEFVLNIKTSSCEQNVRASNLTNGGFRR
ncbi:hypothetical protein SteCoe_33349 [Stentor coeruleus]|uniref:Uncharacterized protein n=1 Tax=Stentor coeruleus TaxID=5963 RepID=A0A1R2AX04_9CILI|nr:hypothetical protein SteCoe_33349 [Stentor coeruleus]